MRRIIWSQRAENDLDNVVSFIGQRSKSSARLVSERIGQAVERLSDIPTGHDGPVAGTFEKVVQRTPYIIAYTASVETIVVLRIIHGARNWPDDSWPLDA